MRLFFTTLALMLAFAGTARAMDTPYGNFSGAVGVTSDYRFRGLSQNDENPAIQGGLDWEHDSGVYVGAWASNVEFPDADVELDVYGGYRHPLQENVTLDLGILGYLYPGADSDLDYDYLELRGATIFDMDAATFTAALNWSPDYFRDTGDAFYLSGKAQVPVSDTGFSVLASAGHQWIEREVRYGVEDYFDWSAGVGYDWKNASIAAKYVDTDLSKGDCFGGRDVCDATGIVTAALHF